MSRLEQKLRQENRSRQLHPRYHSRAVISEKVLIYLEFLNGFILSRYKGVKSQERRKIPKLFKRYLKTWKKIILNTKEIDKYLL